MDSKNYVMNNVILGKFEPSATRINRLITLANLGRYIELESRARLLLEQFPDSGFAWHLLGVSLHFQDKDNEALIAAQKVTELMPELPEAHNNLGNVLQAVGNIDGAKVSYQRALELRPDFIEAHNNLGNALEASGQLDDAITSYQRALELWPDNANVVSNLGVAFLHQGKIVEGERCLRKAIELAPHDAETLSNIFFYIRHKQDDPLLQRLEEIYDRRESLPPAKRVLLNFAFGKAMEDIGQYENAFKAYEEGNQLHHQGNPFNEASFANLVEESCGFYTAELFEQFASVADSLPPIQDQRVPIFIVGMPRAGSSLIEQILASHNDIIGAGELTTFSAIAKNAKLLLAAPTSKQETLLGLRKLGQEYLDRTWKIAPEAHYIIDKMPYNFLYLGLIHLMLPNAIIIHSMRDPMDTCFSCYSLHFKLGQEYSYDQEVLGRYYQRYLKLINHWHDILPPGRILSSHYESIVRDIESETRHLLEHIGLPWDSSCLRFHENERFVITASVVQVRQPIYSSSVARWKRFENHLGPLLETIKGASSPDL
jgi:tetratricopeptide (TPR) repeat protein